MTSASPGPRLLHITTIPLSLFFFRGQAGYMKSRGLDLHAASSPGELLGRFAEEEKVPVEAIEMPRRIAPARDIVAIYRLFRYIKRLHPQIVHAHTPKGGLLGMISAALAGVPVRIYHIHGLPFVTATGLKRKLLRWSELVSCRLAHRVLCVSPSIRGVLVAEGLCQARKADVILNGSINGVDVFQQYNPDKVNRSVGEAMRKQLDIPAGAPVIGFIGRIVRDKGIVELMAAWKTVAEQFPALHLLVVGPIEAQDAVPEEVMSLLRGDARIRLVPQWTDDPAPYYAAMDILVFPTHREGFGLVAIEASAMGLPVVATRIPGCVDAVQDGVTGTLVPPGDSSALAKAISDYLLDADLGRKHGMAGRERVVAMFQREKIWEALYNEYIRLLKENGLPLPAP